MATRLANSWQRVSPQRFRHLRGRCVLQISSSSISSTKLNLKCDHNRAEPQRQIRNNNKIFINKIQIDVILCVNLGLYILLFVFLHRPNAEHIERRHWLLLHPYTMSTHTRVRRFTRISNVWDECRLFVRTSTYRTQHIHSKRIRAHTDVSEVSTHIAPSIHRVYGNKIVCSHASMWAFIQQHASIAHTLTRVHRTPAAVWNANRCSFDTRYFVSYVAKDSSENAAVLLSSLAVTDEKGESEKSQIENTQSFQLFAVLPSIGSISIRQ